MFVFLISLPSWPLPSLPSLSTSPFPCHAYYPARTEGSHAYHCQELHVSSRAAKTVAWKSQPWSLSFPPSHSYIQEQQRSFLCFSFFLRLKLFIRRNFQTFNEKMFSHFSIFLIYILHEIDKPQPLFFCLFFSWHYVGRPEDSNGKQTKDDGTLMTINHKKWARGQTVSCIKPMCARITHASNGVATHKLWMSGQTETTQAQRVNENFHWSRMEHTNNREPGGG